MDIIYVFYNIIQMLLSKIEINLYKHYEQKTESETDG